MPDETLKSGSRLERILRAGHFAVTAELSAPDSANPDAVVREAQKLSGAVDAINATDASGANVHMSSVAICALLARAGYDPVLQVACRDRNRIAIQGDILGAAALGIRNVLCLTGDDTTNGDQPQAKRVFDLDSVRLLRTAKIMRDKGMFLSGRRLETPPRLFLGAAANPFVQPYNWRPLRLAKKIAAGADFIQTQYCYDVARLREFMAHVRDLGLHRQVYILVGVGPLRSDKGAEFMRNHVPGVIIPDAIVDRLRRTPKEKKLEEGKRICLEIIEQVREIEGVAGIHIMAYRLEAHVPELVKAAGLWPRPRLETAAAHQSPAQAGQTHPFR